MHIILRSKVLLTSAGVCGGVLALASASAATWFGYVLSGSILN